MKVKKMVFIGMWLKKKEDRYYATGDEISTNPCENFQNESNGNNDNANNSSQDNNQNNSSNENVQNTPSTDDGVSSDNTQDNNQIVIQIIM